MIDSVIVISGRCVCVCVLRTKYAPLAFESKRIGDAMLPPCVKLRSVKFVIDVRSYTAHYLLAKSLGMIILRQIRAYGDFRVGYHCSIVPTIVMYLAMPETWLQSNVPSPQLFWRQRAYGVLWLVRCWE